MSTYVLMGNTILFSFCLLSNAITSISQQVQRGCQMSLKPERVKNVVG